MPVDVITSIQNYENLQSSIKWDKASGEWFTVMSGVKQGCILSPLLLLL